VLEGAKFGDALLAGANLRGANLSGARELTSRQLSQAWTGRETILPNGKQGVYLKGSGAERPRPPTWARSLRADVTTDAPV
jgi:uncharacterized protein YjbI with pentapeptide repeats